MSKPNSRTTVDESPGGATSRRRMLSGTVGVGASLAGVGLLSGVAAAHFPTKLDFDVQPENEDDFIDLGEDETVTLVVRPTDYLNGDGEVETFDPTERAVRYRFGSRYALDAGDGSRPVDDGDVVRVETDGGDRVEGLELTFPIEGTGLEGREESVWLFWERDESGKHGLSGVDTARVYPGLAEESGLLKFLRHLLCRNRNPGRGR
ncbi:hypothetical protein [Halovivax limisalsi]|uniref:hypothetical protein n=1 Tax=Halovivax limisalsi TaxID=1453760 RepID=UPI001FFC5D61|nr:hypothetical protein [Halovivax limisalsi]